MIVTVKKDTNKSNRVQQNKTNHSFGHVFGKFNLVFGYCMKSPQYFTVKTSCQDLPADSLHFILASVQSVLVIWKCVPQLAVRLGWFEQEAGAVLPGIENRVQLMPSSTFHALYLTYA